MPCPAPARKVAANINEAQPTDLGDGLPAPSLPDPSGRDLHGRVKVHLAGCAPGQHRPETRPRRSQPVCPHASKMKRDRRLDASKRRVDCLSRGHAAWKIGDRRPPVAVGIFVDAHQIPKLPHVFPRFRPACRLTDANVPLGMSSPKLPLTVTRPAFVGCLNCRWLPRVTTSIQPSCSSSRITSRTFTPQSYQIGSILP